MTKSQMLHELEQNPEGKFTKNYLTFLRMLRLELKVRPDQELVDFAIKRIRSEQC